jgi:uncharacterized protein (TIRG00374 family)
MKRPPTWVLTVAAWIVASVLLALCFRGVDWGELLTVLRHASVGWLIAGVLANGATLAIMALQWQIFLPKDARVPLKQTLGISAVMATVANSVPFMAGEAAGVHLLASRGGTGHAKATSVTSLRILSDGTAKLAMLVVLAAIAPLSPSLRRVLVLLSLGVALLLAFVLAAAWSHGRIHLPTGRAGAVGSVARVFHDWSAGLEGARRPSALVWGILLAVMLRSFELTAILCVQAAAGLHLPVADALSVLVAVNISTMVSVAPGNLGVYEGSAYVAYHAFGLARSAGLAVAVLQHAVYLVPMAGTGWVVLMLSRLGSKRTKS